MDSAFGNTLVRTAVSMEDNFINPYISILGYIVFALSLYFIINNRDFIKFFKIIFSSVVYPIDVKHLATKRNLLILQDVSTFFSILIISVAYNFYLLVYRGYVVEVNYIETLFYTLLYVFAFVLLKILIINSLKIFFNQKKLFDYLYRTFMSYIIIFVLLSILIVFVFSIFPEILINIKIYIFIIVTLICVLLYLKSITQLIFSFRFSHFFFFLYLCALELLPILLIIKLILKI